MDFYDFFRHFSGSNSSINEFFNVILVEARDTRIHLKDIFDFRFQKN